MSNYPDKEWMDYVLSQLLDAIKRVEAKVEPLNQNVNLLIQDVRQLQAKLDALENRLLPPGYAFIQKPSEITPAGQVNIPTVFTPPGSEGQINNKEAKL